MLVAAAPGSGKTRVLASRFARLIGEGVPPRSMLAITFTNRAALEMKSRVAALVRGDASPLNIMTFHALCLSFLRKARPGFNLCGRAGQLRLLRRLGVKNQEAALSTISAIKNIGGFEPSPEGLETFALYSKGLGEMEALDLDDLIPETIKTIESDAKSLAFFGFSAVMVDEYQDINRHQALLLRLLARNGATLFCIGDPDQAIYAFRGAKSGGFAEFERDYPGASILSLERNYRSRAKIVLASKAIIENGPSATENRIAAVRDGGEVEIIECADEKDEAAFVVREIERLMGGFTSSSVSSLAADNGFRISDFAVLFRTNRQASALAEAFSRSSLPYRVIGPKGEGVLDLIERLKALVPAPDMGLSEFVRAVGVECCLDHELLDGLVEAAGAYGSSREGLGDFIDDTLLAEQCEDAGIVADRVSLLTMHAAKGLEFAIVFITGVEDGLVPLKPRGGSCDAGEERRLLYVGMTRAKEKLYLLNCRTRRDWAGTLERRPSPFLAEIPDGFITKRVVMEKKKTKRRPEQKGLFD